jgi:hypothetical protein
VVSGEGTGELKGIWNLYKTILINLIVFCGLFLSLEVSYRAWLYFRTCDPVCYNTAFLTKLDAFNRYVSHSTVYGFMTPNPITGYSPTDGTFVIHEPGWNDATITIRQGVRVNPNFTPTSADGAILAVGDSFVFGDQVSDDETWPAILERRVNRRVINGGVSGYGTAQAALRAEHLLKAEPYSLVILSILVANDLVRDQAVRWIVDFYRPVVIRENGRLRQTTEEESRRVVSENFICSHPRIPEFFFWSHVAKRFFSKVGYDGGCTIVTHPKTATRYEILEFVVERLAAFPVSKAILLQYPEYSFPGKDANSIGMLPYRQSIDEARMIREAANRHGVPVIDTYNTLKNEPLSETYNHGSNWWPHHSKKGNEIVADLIEREVRAGVLIATRKD